VPRVPPVDAAVTGIGTMFFPPSAVRRLSLAPESFFSVERRISGGGGARLAVSPQIGCLVPSHRVSSPFAILAAHLTRIFRIEAGDNRGAARRCAPAVPAACATPEAQRNPSAPKLRAGGVAVRRRGVCRDGFVMIGSDRITHNRTTPHQPGAHYTSRFGGADNTAWPWVGGLTVK